MQAREMTTRCDARGAPKTFRRSLASRLLGILHARVCISPAPQSPSPKLETTRSLVGGLGDN